jgi:hypothetical protein
MAKPRKLKHCIFCGFRGKLTREHIWADWLKPYIAKDMPKHSRARAVIHKTHTESAVKLQPGDPRSRRVKCVCGSCNSGWMSKLQQRAKPILLPLIRGERTTLGLAAQQTAAAWIAMAVMVAEFDDPAWVTISQEDRDWLYRTNLAPPSWRIWIGNYVRGEWQPHYVHFVLPIAAEKHVPSAPLEYPDLPYNTQTTTYVVGQTLVHVMSTTPEFVDIVDGWSFPLGIEAKLAQISPSTSASIAWPLDVLSDDDADLIASAFSREIIRVTGGGAGFRP